MNHPVTWLYAMFGLVFAFTLVVCLPVLVVVGIVLYSVVVGIFG